jgi:hypothetical protein
MSEAYVKGNLFQHSLEYVQHKWGQYGSDVLSINKNDFLPERAYPIADFCKLLSKVSNKLGKGQSSDMYFMARGMIKKDDRWQTVFKGQDPLEVFTSTKHQEDQYSVGDHKVEKSETGHVRIKFTPSFDNEDWMKVWCEFYRGRLHGVLDITGHPGTVEMKFKKKRKKRICLYDVTWE